MPTPPDTPLDIRIVTGLSGSGKSTALRVLEDLGWFCVDNLPTVLAGDLVRICSGREDVQRVGLGIDVREKGFLSEFPGAVRALRAAGHKVEIIFLDARDEVLLRRFASTRRPHPLSPDSDVLSGVQRERETLASIRLLADRVLDTSELTVHDLRRQLIEHLTGAVAAENRVVVRIVTFGYKFGVPVDADMVLDARFLPNPYFDDDLRPLPGTDPRVATYVLSSAEAGWFLDRMGELFARLWPHYLRDGRTYFTIAVGCTGGRHRSVALASALAGRLPVARVEVQHRDIDRGSAGGR